MDNVSNIDGYSDDERGIENDGVTKKDLAAARKGDGSDQFRTRHPLDKGQLRLPEYNDPISTRDGLVSNRDFKKEALKLFNQIDSDKDGYLSTKELATAVQDDKYRGNDAQTVAGLYAGRDALEEFAVASIAATQPELIKNMINDNHDGTYTVTFPGDKSQPITVKAPTEAELGIYNRGGASGVWANVLEKAYGKYCQENPSHRSILNLGGGNTPSEGADGGELFAGRAMSLLTGKGRNNDSLTWTSTATLKQRLTDALAGDTKRPVMAGIDGGFGKTTDGFIKAHEYSVIGYDPSGPDGGTVTIRNPWGGDDDSTRGTKKLSLTQFQKNFSDVTISDK